jgi:hypothetical protein
MEKKLVVGEVVIFIDSHRKEHTALVTCIWGDRLGRSGAHGSANWTNGVVDEEALAKATADSLERFPDRVSDFTVGEAGSDWPGINLLFVCGEEDRTDTYGEQIDRESSVVHISNNSAGANCYKFKGE